MAQTRDIFADSENPIQASDEEVASIGYLVKKALDLESEIEAMTAQLKRLTDERAAILDKQLPEALDAANCGEFKDGVSGKKVTIKERVSASISVANRPDAHKWLRQHNHGDIIKNEVVFPLGKELDNVATQLLADVKQMYDIDGERKESVHSSTLAAFCREQLAAGVELPAGLLGLFVQRVAVIK